MENFKPAEIKTTVEKVDEMVPGVRQLIFKLPAGQKFKFNAGQFVMGEFPDKFNPGKTVKRAYSISSSPFEDEFIELAVTRVEGGNASDFINSSMKVGDTFTWKGPFGKFNLPDAPHGRYIFIATGTGITPLRSMFRQLLHDGYQDEIFFFHGCRHDNTHPYFDEMKALEKKHPNFKFHAILSRPEKWTGPKGYVQDLVKQVLKEPVGHIYLCGVGKMIEDNKNNLLSIGFTNEQIHSEKW
jgi:ferredoxin-NADP reductase